MSYTLRFCSTSTSGINNFIIINFVVRDVALSEYCLSDITHHGVLIVNMAVTCELWLNLKHGNNCFYPDEVINAGFVQGPVNIPHTTRRHLVCPLGNFDSSPKRPLFGPIRKCRPANPERYGLGRGTAHVGPTWKPCANPVSALWECPLGPHIFAH